MATSAIEALENTFGAQALNVSKIPNWQSESLSCEIKKIAQQLGLTIIAFQRRRGPDKMDLARLSNQHVWFISRPLTDAKLILYEYAPVACFEQKDGKKRPFTREEVANYEDVSANHGAKLFRKITFDGERCETKFK